MTILTTDNPQKFPPNIIPIKVSANKLIVDESARGIKFNGPLSGPMWRKANRVPSAYPDNFDYSVYDKLLERFGNTPPRGGVVFKKTLKLVNYHSSCSQCHYAFELDTYGRGCIHDCTYCYAKDQLTAHGYWNKPFPFPVDISEIRKIFSTVFESNKPSRWRKVLEKKIPLRIGSMSDSFMLMDHKYRVTHETLKILKFYKYPYIIFTRSDLVSHDDYLEVLDPTLASIQFSICGNNEELTRIIEPGAPNVKRRLKALKKLADHNFWTTVRINPLFPSRPDGYYTDEASIKERFGNLGNVPKLNFFDLDNVGEFLDQLKEAKVPSLLAGFVRLSPHAIKAMSESTGINIKLFFKPEVLRSFKDKHYSDSEIAYYYKRIQFESFRRGIRFNTCYIGNGEKDYYQYQGMWSNKQDCCDARTNVPAFKSSSQELPWELRNQHAPKGQGKNDNKEVTTISLSQSVIKNSNTFTSEDRHV